METSEIKKHRSPAYPSIDLEKAVGRAQRLWDVAGKHPAPLPSATESWGYSAKSSGGLQTVAALKQYGLLVDQGTGWNRELSLTKAAQELFVYGADKASSEWKSRSRAAVLCPKIHAELWEKYNGDLPDDSVIHPYLELDRGFSREAAATMLKHFRASILFAGMTAGPGTVSENGADGEISTEDDEAETDGLVTPATIENEPKPSSEAQRGQRTIQVTYSPTEWALIQAKFPLTEADWDSMIGVLQAMKRGLVTPAGDDDA